MEPGRRYMLHKVTVHLSLSEHFNFVEQVILELGQLSLVLKLKMKITLLYVNVHSLATLEY